jgi:hypothetical protein
VSLTASSNRGAAAGGPWRRSRGRKPQQAWIRPGAAVGASAVMVAAAALTLAAPAAAGVSRSGTAGSAAAYRSLAAHRLHLRGMPAGRVAFSRRHGRLTVHAVMFGLTPGSSHAVSLRVPGRARAIRFSPLRANGVGQAASTLHTHFSGHLRGGSRLLVHMGVGDSRVAREPIAVTRRLSHGSRRAHRLISVEVSQRGISYGTPRGRATIAYNARRQRLTVTVTASGVTPGPHAAHIHLGSCMRQGPVKYMLRDLVASRRGRIAHAVRVFTHVAAPVPASGWYLNIHQGNSSNILSGGQPTIFFRPLLCADIRGSSSIASIPRSGEATASSTT